MTDISNQFGYNKIQNASVAHPNDLDTFSGMAKPPKELLYAESGKRLRLLRLAIHQTNNRRAFCELYGFQPTTWDNYEQGVSRPPPDEALRIKQKFGVTTDWIYAGVEALMPQAILEKMAEIAANEVDAPPRTRRARKAS